MLINIDGETHNVNIKALAHDLTHDDSLADLSGFTLEEDGTLTIYQGNSFETYIARVQGTGCNNFDWGDAPNGYEFLSGGTL